MLILLLYNGASPVQEEEVVTPPVGSGGGYPRGHRRPVKRLNINDDSEVHEIERTIMLFLTRVDND